MKDSRHKIFVQEEGMVIRKLAFALLASLSLLLAACSQATPTTTPPTTPTGTGTPTISPTTTSPKPGATGPYGTLRVALSTFGGERFDPIKSTSTDRLNLQAPLFDFLLRSDGTKPVPSIAEKWEMAPDGLSWTLTIRKGIKFHNGEELTANDVKFSLERYISKDSYYSDLRGMLDRVDAPDSYTVRLYTKGQQPFLLFILYPPTRGQSLIVPKNYFEQRGADSFEASPVGTGPYKFARRVAGDLAEYQADTNNWRLVPAYKTLTIIKIPEETTRVAVLKTAGVDIVDVGLDQSVQLDNAGFKTASLNAEMTVINLHGAYAPESAGKPIADLRVRQALSLAINREEIVNIFFRGKATLPIVPYIFDDSADVDIPYWREYGAKTNAYDLEKAKQLMKDAGYANGFSIKYWSFAQGTAQHLPQMAQLIQGYWLKIGVNAEITPTEFATYNSISNEVTKSAQIIGQSAGYSVGDSSITAQRLRAGFHTNGTLSLLNKKFPEIDSGIGNVMTEPDPAKRKEILTTVIKTVTDSYTQLPIAYVPGMAALANSVKIDFPKPADSLLGYYLELAQHVARP